MSHARTSETRWTLASAVRAAARVSATVLLACLCSGCTTPAEYAHEADLEVDTLLAETRSAALGHREDWVQRPKATAKDTAGAGATGDDGLSQDASAEPLVLDLKTSLQIAVTTGRDYLNRKDGLYQAGLGLTLTRYNFGPLLNGTVGALWGDAKNTPSGSSVAFDLGMTQILPSGGNFSFGGALAATSIGGDDGGAGNTNFDSALNVNLTQPLLRGAGYEVSHEALTQGERNIVYDVRDFELFREDFSIDIARDFFDLVSRKARLVNLEQNLQDVRFDLTKSEALRQVDRNKDEDVFLARRRVIDAETNLLSARADFEQAVDAFKLRLGLETTRPVTIADEEPPFEPVRLDTDSAVRVALHNRLDLITGQERLEDSERNVRIARNSLLPDLGLTLDYGLTGQDGTLVDAFPENPSAAAGLSLQLPLQRQSERNSYRSALISLERARRDYELLLDNTERDILDQLRQLERTEQQIELQKQQIEQEQRAVAVTEIRYEAGDVDNRDLLDARLSLVAAQNALIDLTAGHFIGRLSLLRDMGLLFIDEQGYWRP